jgi:carbon storage regulator CsrA
MLVLSRKIDERIMLTIPGFDDVVITIVDIRTHDGTPKVRVGIDAPESIRIMREEVIGREPRTYNPDNGGPA